jgi:hypothetical protein
MMLGLFGPNQVAAIGSIAGRIRIARGGPQYFETDDGRNECRRGAPFGIDQQDRRSTGWR